MPDLSCNKVLSNIPSMGAFSSLGSVGNLMISTDPSLDNFRQHLVTTSTNDINWYNERVHSSHGSIYPIRQCFVELLYSRLSRASMQINC
mmetsp:Transcript_20339/g.42560  ORF Transcript_20339/g.42560 Transcript_20339/m.42560 type:complete len:90 (+) Transcript_20339:424-693(+)